jgi:hypothetical protein
MPFADSQSAENWFVEALRARGVKKIRQETIVEYVKGGRKAYPKLYYCDDIEAYLVTFWRSSSDQIKASSKMSEFGRELDERIKFTTATFGNGVSQMTQCKEPTLLKLLELDEQGIETFLVTIYSNGDVFWCKARDFYEFATRYGTYQQVSRTPDMAQSLPYRVPTGWMLPWTRKDIIVGPPALATE